MSTPWIVLFVALWLVVIGETVLVLGLSRRLTALESTATRSGATMGAIPVGSRIPPDVVDHLGIASSGTAGSSVILFLSPGCGPCRTLADALEGHTLERDSGDRVEIIVVTNEAGAEAFGRVGRVVLDSNATLAQGFRVPGTPFGFAIDTDGIVRAVGLPNAAEDVQKLIAARRPRPSVVSA